MIRFDNNYNSNIAFYKLKKTITIHFHYNYQSDRLIKPFYCEPKILNRLDLCFKEISLQFIFDSINDYGLRGIHSFNLLQI
jgi:hypothetical protein